MSINDILENEELTKLLNSSISKTYYKYKLSFIIEMEDFIQEVNLFIIKRIKSFDNEKSSIRTYLPMLVMSCARACIQEVNGQSKEHNKLEFRNNTLSLDYEFQNDDNDKLHFGDLVSSMSEDLDTKILINEILQMYRLSKKEKNIIALMREGYTLTDIAEMSGETLNCISMSYRRAKEKIVKRYAR